MTLATPVFFGPEERPLFGWVHQPGGGVSRGTVVMCPPLTRELISAHYSHRVVAEDLARRGITVIRFDYDGTGDSAGSDADPGRVEAYEASIDHAVNLAYDLGTTDLALLGMRMGGLLAARAATRSGRVSALVLWDPCGSGREFAREQSALFRLTYGGPKTEGTTEVAGFVLRDDTVEQLKALRAPEANPSVERALLLTRPDRSPTGNFGVAEDLIEHTVAEGQAELMDIEPFLSAVPASVGTIADWLDSVLPQESVPQKSPDARDAASFATPGGGRVDERLVRVGPGALFGIETTATDEPVGPAILLLTSGNESHIGPNRMWVDLARSWAGLGLRCVRFDLSGMGDSPPRPGRPGHVERAPEAFADIADAVAQWSGGSGGSGHETLAPAVLVGLCSGAYQALDSAIDVWAQGAVAVNPVFRFPPPEAKETDGKVDPHRTLCRPVDESLRSKYQRLPDWKVVRLARRAYMTAGRLRARQRTVPQWLDEMSSRGTDVLCICGGQEADAMFEGSRKPPGTHATLGSHAVVEIIEDLDHGLIPATSRNQVAALMTDFLVERYLGGAAPGGPSRRTGEGQAGSSPAR